ncbi:MAG: sigma-70 family polymerase sigma factor [Flavipsychrobacter sp.]|nr:sigma-70 family polymerase sigma factor [Flavipsychrobacter sp.]
MSTHNHHTHLSDEELLQAFRAGGDTQWLGYLLQRYTTLLLGVAMKYLKDRSLAEDAVQQVFLKVLTHLPQEEILNFKGWLYILMRNHCLQQLRDKTHIADETAIAHIADSDSDKEDALWHEHTLEQMNEAIDLLTEEQRKAIILFYLKKYSYEQIIAQTGYTFMQVKSYVQNGKRNLKTILLKKLGTRQ